MDLILTLSIVVVLTTIGSGVYLLKNNRDKSKNKIRKALGVNLLSFIPLLIMAMVIISPNSSFAATDANASANGLGMLAAALSTGFATIGTGYAVGVVGSAALGAVSEDDTLLGKTLIYVGLAEGIAIYGLVISIMILGRL
ncbi:ATP synthase subunit C [Lagierella sp.]|uniref:ATP synthase subunit C n=1 Tax=Lagierella sp. TaxID=2849657 RepID=UPI002608CE56|nr:ATP synthase subunit C [Lagierella sp.]